MQDENQFTGSGKAMTPPREPFFKPEDFLFHSHDVIPGQKDSLDCIAAIANRLVEPLLKAVEKAKEKMDNEAPALSEAYQTIAKLREENDRLRAELNREAYATDLARKERNKAETELDTLKAEIEQAPVVTCRLRNGKWFGDEDERFTGPFKARLVRIEEIKK